MFADHSSLGWLIFLTIQTPCKGLILGMTTKVICRFIVTQKRGDTISSDGTNRLRGGRQDSNPISDAKLLLDVSGIEKCVTSVPNV